MYSIFIAVLFFILSISSVSAATIQVKPGDSIQEAVDRAADGDTIELQEGVYRERFVIIPQGKALTLKGSSDKVYWFFNELSTLNTKNILIERLNMIREFPDRTDNTSFNKTLGAEINNINSRDNPQDPDRSFPLNVLIRDCFFLGVSFFLDVPPADFVDFGGNNQDVSIENSTLLIEGFTKEINLDNVKVLGPITTIPPINGFLTANEITIKDTMFAYNAQETNAISPLIMDFLNLGGFDPSDNDIITISGNNFFPGDGIKSLVRIRAIFGFEPADTTFNTAADLNNNSPFISQRVNNDNTVVTVRMNASGNTSTDPEISIFQNNSGLLDREIAGDFLEELAQAPDQIAVEAIEALKGSINKENNLSFEDIEKILKAKGNNKPDKDPGDKKPKKAKPIKVKGPQGIKIKGSKDEAENIESIINIDNNDFKYNIKGEVRKSVEQEIFDLKAPLALSIRLTNNGSKAFEFVARLFKKRGGGEEVIRQTIEVGAEGVFELPFKGNYQIDLTRTDNDADDKIPFDFDLEFFDLKKNQRIDNILDLFAEGVLIDGDFAGFDKEELILFDAPAAAIIELTDNQNPPTVKVRLFESNSKAKVKDKFEITPTVNGNVSSFVLPDAATYAVIITPLDPDGAGDYSFNVKAILGEQN